MNFIAQISCYGIGERSSQFAISNWLMDLVIMINGIWIRLVSARSVQQIVCCCGGGGYVPKGFLLNLNMKWNFLLNVSITFWYFDLTLPAILLYNKQD